MSISVCPLLASKTPVLLIYQWRSSTVCPSLCAPLSLPPPRRGRSIVVEIRSSRQHKFLKVQYSILRSKESEVMHSGKTYSSRWPGKDFTSSWEVQFTHNYGYIEWANLVLGFEQLLRTRRPFIAYIVDAMGNELFRVRRPIWFINSTIYTEVNGKEIGVVHRRWHLWRRIYDLYLGNQQFAVVENLGFWNWTFTLKDYEGNVLAEIDRDWRGIGFELFTDAGQNVIRFGEVDSRFTSGRTGQITE
ncbi:hypothetical protein H6P81_007282 [Aristolochia fimbriata]|uniref:Phospholipid scramblase n=1 Tax=Aristolochia fimbriata TaxID=158543 RepID=A0AAV7F019_ARIFI|nr:hypothetical protein H6P81_007282 [Aristolochia fimbriata]